MYFNITNIFYITDIFCLSFTMKTAGMMQLFGTASSVHGNCKNVVTCSLSSIVTGIICESLMMFMFVMLFIEIPLSCFVVRLSVLSRYYSIYFPS